MKTQTTESPNAEFRDALRSQARSGSDATPDQISLQLVMRLGDLVGQVLAAANKPQDDKIRKRPAEAW